MEKNHCYECGEEYTCEANPETGEIPAFCPPCQAMISLGEKAEELDRRFEVLSTMMGTDEEIDFDTISPDELEKLLDEWQKELDELDRLYAEASVLEAGKKTAEKGG